MSEFSMWYYTGTQQVNSRHSSVYTFYHQSATYSTLNKYTRDIDAPCWSSPMKQISPSCPKILGQNTHTHIITKIIIKIYINTRQVQEQTWTKTKILKNITNICNIFTQKTNINTNMNTSTRANTNFLELFRTI